MEQDRQRAIAAMGQELGPQVVEACRALYAADHAALAAHMPVLAADCAYGPHERQRLDVYHTGAATDAPVVLFVHGGGFRMGDKAGGANVARAMAQAGFAGAAMNYRLLPDAHWPEGGEDVVAAVDWLRAHAHRHGGNPARIVLIGTSAGAVHIATALKLRPDLPIAGAVLLSGLYGHTPLDARDVPYYGADTLYPDRMPRTAVAQTAIPLFVACAQYDPPRFQAEFLGLMHERLAAHGTMPAGTIVPGHNHYTLAMHIGSDDCRLTNEIVRFIRSL